MSQQFKHILFFLIIAVISYGLYSYYFNQEEVIVSKPFTKGYSIENIELKITDDSGLLTAQFKSPSLMRYTNEDDVYIQSPIFWTYNNGKKHWQIKSEKAKFNALNQVVNLSDNLIAKTLHSPTPMYFKADNLTVDLQTKFAHTNDGILLSQDNFKMSGQQAKIDLNNEQIEVNNNVKAVYKAKK